MGSQRKTRRAIHGFPRSSALTAANIAPVRLAWDHQTALIISNGPHYGQELSTSGLSVIREEAVLASGSCQWHAASCPSGLEKRREIQIFRKLK
jgi:hypothetical protein